MLNGLQSNSKLHASVTKGAYWQEIARNKGVSALECRTRGRSVGPVIRPEKKKDFAQKKVWEVHTTQWAHRSIVDQRRALKQLVYSLFYQKKIHSTMILVPLWYSCGLKFNFCCTVQAEWVWNKRVCHIASHILWKAGRSSSKICDIRQIYQQWPQKL